VTASYGELTARRNTFGRLTRGCDGGASQIRKQLGIQLRGEGNSAKLRQALFRCDELYDGCRSASAPVGASLPQR